MFDAIGVIIFGCIIGFAVLMGIGAMYLLCRTCCHEK